MYIRRGSYGGHLIARSLSPASSKLVELVFTFATQVYKLQMVRWPFECSFDSYLPSLPGHINCRNCGGHSIVCSLSPAVSRYTSWRNYGAHLMVRSLSPAVSRLVGLVFTLATWVYKLEKLRCPFDVSRYISCKNYGGRLFVRSLSPAVSKLVGLVFTLATWVYKLQRVRSPFVCSLTVPCSLKVYKLQKLRCPFDGSPLSPAVSKYTSYKNYGAHLMVRHCLLQSQTLNGLVGLVFTFTTQVYKLQKLRCPFDGSPLSPAVSKLVGLVFTLATWVYKLQMVRWPFECSFDSYLPSLLGYISCRNYGGRLFVRSLSPAVSRLVGLVFTLATWVYKLQRARSTRIYPRYLGISAAKTTVAVCLFAHCPLQSQGIQAAETTVAVCLFAHCPLQSQGIQAAETTVAVCLFAHCPLQSQSSLDSYSPSLPGYISYRWYGGHLSVRSLSPASSRLIITLSSNNNNSPRSAGLLLVQDHHLLALKHHQRTPKNLCVLKQVLMSNCNLAHNQFGNSGYSSAWTSIPGANKDRPSFIADAATTTA
ncbi:uncharacterized protein C8R40DRAFT_1067364 [Lentinula edodes]|uniref:uncharacterized protein n=1 Tax=Lentinula edodes TaxID=5353 RepID=UPI001E8D4891|nr:uncharacterized protein C8R40DRAFT_1067364 [Lentinula edodes]KAH7878343.1 hypothetical protein C8R40DRAFT_1067364 [Lentinula edodes]